MTTEFRSLVHESRAKERARVPAHPEGEKGEPHASGGVIPHSPLALERSPRSRLTGLRRPPMGTSEEPSTRGSRKEDHKWLPSRRFREALSQWPHEGMRVAGS